MILIYRPSKGGSPSRGTAVSVQPVPKAAYRSDFRENTNFCPQRDANLGPLAPQASVLPLHHCDLRRDVLHSDGPHSLYVVFLFFFFYWFRGFDSVWFLKFAEPSAIYRSYGTLFSRC